MVTTIVNSGKLHWNYGKRGLVRWRENCEFVGYDIGNQSSPTSDDCGGLCIEDEQCNAFTYNSGVCYKKTIPYSLTKTDIVGSVCGWITIR